MSPSPTESTRININSPKSRNTSLFNIKCEPKIRVQNQKIRKQTHILKFETAKLEEYLDKIESKIKHKSTYDLDKLNKIYCDSIEEFSDLIKNYTFEGSNLLLRISMGV